MLEIWNLRATQSNTEKGDPEINECDSSRRRMMIIIMTENVICLAVLLIFLSESLTTSESNACTADSLQSCLSSLPAVWHKKNLPFIETGWNATETFYERKTPSAHRNRSGNRLLYRDILYVLECARRDQDKTWKNITAERDSTPDFTTSYTDRIILRSQIRYLSQNRWIG